MARKDVFVISPLSSSQSTATAALADISEQLAVPSCRGNLMKR